MNYLDDLPDNLQEAIALLRLPRCARNDKPCHRDGRANLTPNVKLGAFGSSY
jgi:hypothetical protein